MDLSDDFVNEKCVFGEIKLNVISKQFKGGKIEAVFAGGKINLLNAELSTEGKNVLEVDLVFGGIDLIVPHDWNVVIKTNSILGGFSEKRNLYRNAIDPAKELIIVGKTIFGGGDIKRY
jgi:predicted membrane protein